MKNFFIQTDIFFIHVITRNRAVSHGRIIFHVPTPISEKGLSTEYVD